MECLARPKNITFAPLTLSSKPDCLTDQPELHIPSL